MDVNEVTPPLQRRSKDTLDAITNATKELLQTHSFAELTIQNIVKKANSSAGSFYARFKGKSALLHFLHQEYAETSLRDLSEAIERSDKRLLTPAELAESFIPALLRSHDENRGIFRATLIESMHDPLFSERAMKLVKTVATTLAAYITPTAKRRDHHVLNVQRTLFVMIAILDQDLFYLKTAPRRSKVEIARLERIFVASLGPEAGS